ncbi:aminotransferase class I/II-fold pyridoxal phosphate-dependent enzyme [Oenococcus sicerae]|uniref:Aminotransferase n=1 Tax=Oenococcus sicerae TaxID=2203724 RepID=A0AAJ1R8D1_9LACO|nr:aminotransferase class I/II-fold pyridoxal phosphate-dependent enzyme [Oenococcus sicerae]MDN6899626.1 aminotransferase class I/II-fold pyridoxal phosphate-dependent enzyme [Oenococcus sicerae]QAS70314.1 aminotransferase class I/II-fold pyridoxal phosphate-dependent enzyme [Oenococcus sicerae]VDK13495.1 Putative N-acetyl-LL-diaminopimelate aminotransferase [Oenococcus sicerae]
MSNFILPLNTTVDNLKRDPILDFQANIRDIDDLIQLTFGEPGFAVDDRIKAVAKVSIDHDRSHYANSQGEVNLRRAAVSYFNRHFNLKFKGIEDVLVTQGVSEGINVVFMTILEHGDGVIIPEPSYSPYTTSLTLAGGIKIPLDTSKNDFKITPESIEKTISEASIPVKAILINYPANPTGVTYSNDELQAIADTLKKHKIWVISDEIYAALTYSGQHTSLYKLLPKQSILLTGLSKSHAMTGYRIGFIFADSKLIAKMLTVHEALAFAVSTLCQDAAFAALTVGEDVPEYALKAYRKRRDFLVKTLIELGFQPVNPQGAFYVFTKIPQKFGNDGYAFAVDLAKNAKVAVLPGEAFSKTTPNYIRISYASSDNDLKEALKRMKNYLQNGVKYE